MREFILKKNYFIHRNLSYIESIFLFYIRYISYDTNDDNTSNYNNDEDNDELQINNRFRALVVIIHYCCNCHYYSLLLFSIFIFSLFLLYKYCYYHRFYQFLLFHQR